MGTEIGALLRNKRREQKLTLRQLAEKTGIDYSMLSKYENGYVTPPAERLLTISTALNIGEDAFLSSKEVSEMDIATRRRSYFTSVNDDQYVVSDSAAGQVVLEAANGTCELCGVEFAEIPDFLEVHYVVWLRDGGTPTIDNTVALCPNCHKRVHLTTDPSLTEKLLSIAKSHK